MTTRANQQPTDGALLARIDERTAQLQRDMESIKALIESRYVTKNEFTPVKTVVYGLVAAVMTGVFGALLTLVLRSSK